MAGVAKSSRSILWFSEIEIGDIPLVGGKNASLGEMYSNLTKKGISIPNGFAISAHAYREFIRANQLERQIKQALKGLVITDVRALAAAGAKIRQLILSASFPEKLVEEIAQAYQKLSAARGGDHLAVAVRSSATAEDLPEASFAGQQETYLNVRGEAELLLSVKKCIASLFTNRAISYREAQGFDHLSVALSVAVQEMVRSDLGASGVMFTLDTESGFRGVVLINAAYGLGEYVVKGRVIPDQFYVFKEGLKQGKEAVISRILGTKEVKLVYGPQSGTKQKTVSGADRNRFAINNADVAQLARWGMMIEEYYQKPQDIEWAKDGQSGKLYIVQARPETVKARSSHSVIEKYELKKKGQALANGIAVGEKIGAGKVRVIEDPRDMKLFKKGEVLVTRITDPDWEPIMRIAAAIVTEQGGKTSHAAIVSREIGVPCVVGAKHARELLKTGQADTVSCAGGDTGVVYKGILPFEVKRTEIISVAKTKTQIMMNVGDPDHAFSLSFLPNDGVGLAREEFIFTNFIRIHPLALIHYKELKDKAAKKKIAAMTRGYKNKETYCVDKLAEGVARIAAAFYPHDVIIRFSDFKTNEYATLIGGRQFEPKEENPMLGWRGASRYYSKEYRDGFRLECEAMRRVRNDWGLTNVVTMVPFCRTPEEGEKAIKTMAEFGLKQGENGLRVYVMCEIPSNVVLAEEFAKIFDGFSIGSNDLTQLTLGVDRDSPFVAHVYDENNLAVKTLIRDVIRVAHAQGRKIGICGQAPSDYPEFAEFLVREGVDSISLNPDTVVATRERIAYVEKTVGKTGEKTSAPSVSLVAMVGIVAAAFIGLGAGCAGSSLAESRSATDISPALVREKLTEKMKQAQAGAEQDKQQAVANQLSTLSIATFANFTLQYPSIFTVEQWNGGVTLKHPTNGTYVSIFRQVLGHPVPDSGKQAAEAGGLKGVRYEDTSAKDGTKIFVVELSLEGGEVLEINGNSEKFNDILATIKFNKEENISSRPITHWDIRERRICAQVITYARETAGAKCLAYSTPCDVPAGAKVCDARDTK
ncbi:MAG: phosphoenolpyruvate synthase [Candidatus Magasanikbacteria bacterium]|nr:phosphoenolpyruvate synthase [Candidatus Magasanikbacteria bacterium]